MSIIIRVHLIEKSMFVMLIDCSAMNHHPTMCPNKPRAEQGVKIRFSDSDECARFYFNAQTYASVERFPGEHDTNRCVRVLLRGERDLFVKLLDRIQQHFPVHVCSDPFRNRFATFSSYSISLFFAALWMRIAIISDSYGCKLHSCKLSNCMNIFSRAFAHSFASRIHKISLNYDSNLFICSGRRLRSMTVVAVARSSFHLPRFTAFIAFNVRFEPCLSFRLAVTKRIVRNRARNRMKKQTGIVFSFLCLRVLSSLALWCTRVTWYSSGLTLARCAHAVHLHRRGAWGMRGMDTWCMISQNAFTLCSQRARVRDTNETKYVSTIERALASTTIKLNVERWERANGWERERAKKKTGIRKQSSCIIEPMIHWTWIP